MISAHITSFLKLISAQLEEPSRGVTCSHHFHNVQCGIENILSLLEYNNDLVDKALASAECRLPESLHFTECGGTQFILSDRSARASCRHFSFFRSQRPGFVIL